MKLNIILVVSLISLQLAMLSCVAVSPNNHREVLADTLFESDFLNIRSPNSYGWQLLDNSSTQIVFARHGIAEPNRSFIAQVNIFKLQLTQNHEEFLDLIKQGVAKDTDTNRFIKVESNYLYTEDRGYPCVKISNIHEDKKAQTSSAIREKLLLQSETLYCRHPVQQDKGFSIHYSHRGMTIYPDLKTEAQEFINGIQVPTH